MVDGLRRGRARAAPIRPAWSETSPTDLTRRRLAALDIGSTPLCFGRLDLDADGDADGRAERAGSSTWAASPSPTRASHR